MYNRDLRILYVTSYFPGTISGGAARILNIGRLLKQLGRVSLVTASTGNVDPERLNFVRNEFDVRHIAQVNPDPLRNYWERIRYELDPSFLNTGFLVGGARDLEMMGQIVHEHDVTFIHSLRTANIFRIYKWPNSLIDLDDLQCRVYNSKARVASSAVRKILDHRMSLVWRRRESLLKDRFDAIAVCSENDKEYLSGISRESGAVSSRIHVIPNGFDPPVRVVERRATSPPRVGFIGACGFAPNRHGVEWFIREIWPRIKLDVPDIRLRLVGKQSDEGFPKLGPDIDGLGFVADPAEEIATWSAMIIPIRYGGGTRVKIVEAFSRRCPVVSTSVGAFGYEVVNGQHLLLGDHPEEFSAACVQLIKNPSLGMQISESAWEKYLRNWTWDSIGPSVSKAVENCLSKKQGAACLS